MDLLLVVWGLGMLQLGRLLVVGEMAKVVSMQEKWELKGMLGIFGENAGSGWVLKEK